MRIKCKTSGVYEEMSNVNSKVRVLKIYFVNAT